MIENLNGIHETVNYKDGANIRLYENDEPLVNKHIVVGNYSASTEDKLLVISPEDLDGERVIL